MNTKKKLLLTIIILLVLIAIIIITIKCIEINKGKKILKEQEESYVYTIENPGMIINGFTPEEVKNANWYFTIKGCVDKYIEYVEKEDNTAIYNLLDKEYVNQNKITEDNVLKIVGENKLNNNYKINKMYQITGKSFATYYVKGRTNNIEIYFIVNIDNSSKAFSIAYLTKSDYDKEISTPVQREQKYEDTIERNSYNRIIYQNYSEEEVIEEYLQDYLENALFNIEAAYNSLDIEYKQLKFKNINEYKTYVNNNREMLESMCKATWKTYTDFNNSDEFEKYFAQINKNGLDKYQISKDNNNKRYICIDTYGNYYIFSVESIMNYTIMLDTYTVDLPEFTEKYYNAEDTEKVALNIQKVFEAMNDKDYNYIYGKLADGFKEKYFKTVDDFEKYIKENFFEENEVDYLVYKKESEEYYSYVIDVYKKGTKDKKRIRIIMELKSGTDYVFSFNVE